MEKQRSKNNNNNNKNNNKHNENKRNQVYNRLKIVTYNYRIPTWLYKGPPCVVHCERSVMATLGHRLLALSLVPLVLCYPNPPTCYSKVLGMGRDVTYQAAVVKMETETRRCMAHIPELYIDVHNACVMPKMRQYVYLVEDLRARRCAYTRKLHVLGQTVRQLYIIMSERCHG
uniref:Cytokine-like protein 1 n=2 Tax=Esox lucius TaxID=8010 RepID=A0A3P9AP63_ESOLU